MKKAVLLALILGPAFSAVLFAAEGYTVQSVSGRVEREVSPGKWEAVTVGMTLSAGAVINTSLNSSLVLNDGSGTITIKAMQKGTVESLAAAAAASGIRIGGKVTDSKSLAAERRTPNISTASTRAGNGTEDTEWVE
jgi:hypothetical protein